ncbi:N-succinylglutamate 5-semialdehyde dehydrogenase [invertebrate metagenome]|uniref:N-succinylglutamate 5-semialdehyde dehydrogenase n=1 Tax=invertebrate metagenome TaxID=1711999 RepID=A0A2H9T717_9ZZZZ
MGKSLFINGQWLTGQGSSMTSLDPSTGQPLWHGNGASFRQVNNAVKSARTAFPKWSVLSPAERHATILAFTHLLAQKSHQKNMAETISRETGKPLWETQTEVNAMIGKATVSLDAYHQRTGHHQSDLPLGSAVLRHKPHGVVAVFGPYNFPGHLPNGHIIPALLAGNTVVFKPSELTPAVAELTVQLWEQAGLPEGVINLLQGERDTAIALASHPNIDGLFFTGSSATGKLLHQQFGGQSQKILALEMGGNNPLIIGKTKNIRAVIHDIIHSFLISTGQRCTCARRLFIPDTDQGNQMITQLTDAARKTVIGQWNADPAPFIGPMISEPAVQHILQAQDKLIKKGGSSLLMATPGTPGTGFISPGIIDVSSLMNQNQLPDEEYFGPLLQVIRYRDFKTAIKQANQTRFGLSAGLFSEDRSQYELFSRHIRAGIVNWNKPLTGASSNLPFGGIGDSGNHRPGAYYAADYCAYPVASMESEKPELPDNLAPGLIL